jgi:hypothetical protein
MRSFVWPGSTPSTAKTAVLLPGSGYTVQAPLLYWCANLLRDAGWHVRAVEWTVTDEALRDPTAFVERAVEMAFADAGLANSRSGSMDDLMDDAAPATRLVVAKSFGTFALPWAIREGVPGVWLTPVLTETALSEALASADATHLAIGGSQDPMWVPESAAGTRATLSTIPGADHRLEVEDGWQASLEVQRDLMKSISENVANRVAGSA